MTLNELGVGATAVVADVGEIADGALAHQMAVLGVRPGQQIAMLKRAIGGARVVGVDGGRIAIDQRTATRIRIAPTAAA